MSDSLPDDGATDAGDGGYFEHQAIASALLPNKARDYVGTPVFGDEARATLASLETMAMLSGDDAALPGTEARGGWFGDRHLEYWLTGLRNVKIAMKSAGLARDGASRVLDFGGGPARLTRHLVQELPHAQLYMSDASARNVALTNMTLGGRAWAFRTTPTPHLPFTDHALDVILAFSAFTETEDDTAWLLEFKRVLTPGGVLYTTVFDDLSWTRPPEYSLPAELMKEPAFRSYRRRTPEICDRTVYFRSEAAGSGCVVFHPERYIRTVWGRVFDVESIVSGAHGEQAGVLLRA